MESEYRPQVNEAACDAVQPGAGNDPSESAINSIHALMKQSRLQLPDINAYSLQWSDLKTETGRGRVPEAIRHMVFHVSNGLDFVLFEHLNLEQQASILREFQGYQEAEGIAHLELSYEEGMILRDAAAAVNVAYDPGTPDEIEKRTFTFSDLEAHASSEALALRDWYAANNM